VLIVPAPVDGVTAHATAVLVVFPTVAVNCCVCPPLRLALPGTTETVTGGDSVNVAVADFVLSAWLVAEIVTVCVAVIAAGAA
jgi:hypothetical protein